MGLEKELFLLTGSNLGDRLSRLNEAFVKLSQVFGKAKILSSIYETEAWGNTEQSPFLNQVIVFRTFSDPKTVLHQILEIESRMGRKREAKWSARIIDIDILYYNDLVFEDAELSIPHPYIAQRRFTLLPLFEIAPQKTHPKSGLTTQEMLTQCEDKLIVNLYAKDFSPQFPEQSS